MRITSTSLSSTGQSPWLNLDEAQNAFGVGFNVDLNSTASGITFKIEHTFDDLGKYVYATISRSLTTVTVTVPAGHDLNTGDSIVVRNANTLSGAAGLDGTYNVTVSNATTLTYTSGTSGTVASTSGIEVCLIRVQTHSTITGNASSVDGNYAFPIEAMRLNVTAWTAGKATLTIVQGRK